MLKKRELKIRLEKTPKRENEYPTQDPNPLGMALIASAPKILAMGVVALFAYVALDTKRQVAVENARHQN